MADTIITPNMSLPNPVPSVAPGPAWAQDLYSCLTMVDSHTHAPGSGVQVTPSGLNINATLPFGGNQASQLLTTTYNNQSAPLDTTAYADSVYVSGGELYFNDGAGNAVQLTSGGSVNATSSGISSGTATASFVGGILVVNSNTNIPADIQVGNVKIGDDTSDGKFIKLAPTAGFSSYTLSLPVLPVAQGIMQMDTSGNVTVSPSVDNTTLQFSSSQLSIKNAGVTGTKIASNTIQQSNMAILKHSPNSSLITFTTSSTTDVVVTGLSTTITTSGGDVLVMFNGAIGSLRFATNGAAGFSDYGVFSIYRGATLISEVQVGEVQANAMIIPPGVLNCVDLNVPAGSHTYTCKMRVVNNSGASMRFDLNATLIVTYEL